MNILFHILRLLWSYVKNMGGTSKMDKESLVKLEKAVGEGDISKEQLSKELTEQVEVANEILQRQEEERLKSSITNPSAIALSTTPKEAGEGLNRVRKTVKQLFTLYLTNQFIARAVNVRADTLISRGYEIIGEDAKGVEVCKKLIENSGGINLFWQLSVNVDIAGDGFLEKIYNLNKTTITRLKHVHPLTLSFRRDRFDRIIVGSDKEPIGYVQYYVDEEGVTREKNVPKDIISHLKFNTLGDEFTGVSILQPVYDTAVRLMNMEYAAAEAAVKAANPLLIAKCNTKSPMQIAQWGTILGRISGKDQIFIPEGMEITMLAPERQIFSEYADYFLNAVVSATGVPKAVLLGASGSGGSNRAEGIVLTRHFYSLIRSNQKYMEGFFNKIFEECAELGNFKAPKLVFNDVAEDAGTLAAQSAVNLYKAGIINLSEARAMIGLEKSNISGSDLKSEIKKSDMETWHPASPGKPAGSQAGIKKTQKISPMSEVNPITK